MRKPAIVFLGLCAVAVCSCDSSRPEDRVDLPPGVFEATVIEANLAERTYQGTAFFETVGAGVFRSFRVILAVEDETIRIEWGGGERPESDAYTVRSLTGPDGSVSVTYSVLVVPDSLLTPYNVQYSPAGDNAGFVTIHTSASDQFIGVFDAVLRDMTDSSAESIIVRGRFHALPE